MSAAMQAALDRIAAEMPAVVVAAAQRREAHMIAHEAARIAANPMLLDDIPGLAAWSASRSIAAVCEALLDEPRAVGVLRLRGALEYARRELAKEAA